jgi:hypothetical protein
MPARTDLDVERLNLAVVADMGQRALDIFFRGPVPDQRRQWCGQRDIQRLVALKQRIGIGAIRRKRCGCRRQEAQQ